MYNVIPDQPPNGLTVVELFAGGGLMAAGLKAAGYEIIWANDFNKQACTAYRHNLGNYIVQGDITQMDPGDIPDADVIAGGPPCQDYSVAGDGAGEDGERGKLVWTYLSIIERKQPLAFIFENVKGLLGKAHKHTFDVLMSEFSAIGYAVNHKIVNAWDYGVAQKRERVFIVGIRDDLGFTFAFPEPFPEDYRTQLLRDVIGDLPEPGSQKNHNPQELSEEAIAYLHRRGGESLKKHRPPTLDEPSSTIVSNFAKGVPYGLHYPDNHERKEISEKALEGYARRGGHGGFTLRVNKWEDPSPTIFGRIYNEGKAFVHPGIPRRPRRFTLRECLRIQSVPDWYVLPDSISLSAQYRVVGNGVASRVAYLLGSSLADQLKAGGYGNSERQLDLFEFIDKRRVPRQRIRERKEEQA